MFGLRKSALLILVIFSVFNCRKPYEPPAIKASSHILAIDGVINMGANSSSQFVLTRSRSLLDTVTDLPELGAQVMIRSASGTNYPLTDAGANGIYISELLNLDAGQKYQLAVTTAEGSKYLSDLVTPKLSAPIDSVNWDLEEDPSFGTEVANVYVNSHDPSNSTKFYRWDYLETWQHVSIYESFWALGPGSIEYGLFPSQTTHTCWSTALSTSIALGTTITLSSDVISQIKVATFSKDDPKMDIKYSMLVRQYPLDEQAYTYWLNVQKNSQSLGGLFDLQPGQLPGNIHGVTNSKDPVVGYISACSIGEKRIFISNDQLPGWQSNPEKNCPLLTIAPPDPNNVVYWNYPDTSFQLYYYASGAMIITYKTCLNCMYQG
ncbi:MAG TPA: DUF4249 domain-containing protein, partial [Puia sp.]